MARRCTDSRKKYQKKVRNALLATGQARDQTHTNPFVDRLAAAYGGYQTGLAASQLATGAEVNQLGVATGRQLTPAELGEKAADVTVGGAMIGAGAASALRGRWAAQAVAGAEAQGAAGTWRSWLFRRKAPNKPGSQGNKAPANPSEPTPYGGENPDPWTPPPGSSQSGGSPVAGPGTGAGAGSNILNAFDPFVGTGSNKGFGQLIGWGTGAQDATSRAASITLKEIQQAGITRSVAEYLLNFYKNAVATGKGGATAPERIRLMQRVLELLGE